MAHSYDYYIVQCKTGEQAQEILSKNKDLPAFYLFSISANADGILIVFAVKNGTEGVDVTYVK